MADLPHSLFSQMTTPIAPFVNKDAENARSKWLIDNQWNTISLNDGRESPSNMKYMVVGVDTMSKSIVEIAWKLYDAHFDNVFPVESLDSLILEFGHL